MTSDILTVTANGAEIEYFKYGQGNLPLVVLPGLSIKSILLYKEMVAGTLKLFGESFEVYVFDRRKNLPSSYSIDDMAADYIAAFDALGIKNAGIYGISQGGMIALSLTISRPDLAGALVLGSTASRIDEMAVDNVIEWNRLAHAKDEDGLITAFASKVYSKAFYEQYGHLIREANKGITDEEFRRLAILTDEMAGFDVFGMLDLIKCPVLVMAGSDDAVLGFTASLDMIKQLDPEMCESYIFEGFGHAVYDENDEFKERANAFFIKSLL